jgi:predicted transcriptional regulator
VTPKRRQLPLSAVLGPLEAEVMEAVWRGGDVTVRDVQQELAGQRPVAYTTVMTTMGRLADKGFLRRVESQPAHRYSAILTREQYADSAVKSVLDWLVGTFGDPAVAYFVDRVERQDEALIASLREAIAQRESRSEHPPSPKESARADG